MRRAFVLALAVLTLPYSQVHAAENDAAQAEELAVGEIAISAELVSAYGEVAAAKAALYHHRFVEVPRRRQMLTQELELTARAVLVQRRRLDGYQSFLRVKRNWSPVESAAEDVWLALTAAEQRLADLRNQQANLSRTARAETKLHSLRYLEAAMRYQALHAELNAR